MWSFEGFEVAHFSGDQIMKLGTETANIVNHLMAISGQEVPEVGMGATVLRWTDRTACTIIKVSPSLKTISVQEDKATRVDSNGMSEIQQYLYETNPEGIIHTFRKTKKGWRTAGGGHGLLIGRRCQYHDFSF
jgi:predicted flavoprotein YhiN